MRVSECECECVCGCVRKKYRENGGGIWKERGRERREERDRLLECAPRPVSTVVAAAYVIENLIE